MGEEVTFTYHETGFHDYIENPKHCAKDYYYQVTHNINIGQIIFINRSWRWRQSDSAVLAEDSLVPISEKLKELNNE